MPGQCNRAGTSCAADVRFNRLAFPLFPPRARPGTMPTRAASQEDTQLLQSILTDVGTLALADASTDAHIALMYAGIDSLSAGPCTPRLLASFIKASQRFPLCTFSPPTFGTAFNSALRSLTSETCDQRVSSPIFNAVPFLPPRVANGDGRPAKPT